MNLFLQFNSEKSIGNTFIDYVKKFCNSIPPFRHKKKEEKKFSFLFNYDRYT